MSLQVAKRRHMRPKWLSHSSAVADVEFEARSLRGLHVCLSTRAVSRARIWTPISVRHSSWDEVLRHPVNGKEMQVQVSVPPMQRAEWAWESAP